MMCLFCVCFHFSLSLAPRQLNKKHALFILTTYLSIELQMGFISGFAQGRNFPITIYLRIEEKNSSFFILF